MRGPAAILGDGFEIAFNVAPARRQNTPASFLAPQRLKAHAARRVPSGLAATTELVAFLRLFLQLPSIDEIPPNPDSYAARLDEPSARIAIATASGPGPTDHSIAKRYAVISIWMPTEMRVSGDARRSGGANRLGYHPHAGIRSLRSGTCGVMWCLKLCCVAVSMRSNHAVMKRC